MLEECLTGPEVSFFALCDGTRALPLMSAQDHKRVFDGDRGPNTGGMGAFAPSPLVDEAMQARIMREIVEPVIARHARGRPRVPRLPLRWPDAHLRRPEGDRVQRAVRRSRSAGRDPDDRRASSRRSSPAAADGALPSRPPRIQPAANMSASSLAAEGYPGAVRTGSPIHGLDQAAELDDVLIFHAGTRSTMAGWSRPAAACSRSWDAVILSRMRSPRLRRRGANQLRTACNTERTSAGRS